MTRPSLEQAVAQWLAKFPHGYGCTGVIACICDREQRIAARVAAFGQQMWDLGVSTQRYGEPTRGAFNDDFAAALRALTQQETP